VFLLFRIVAVVALIWLIAELAEAYSNRIGFRSVVIDAFLTLPMFVLWLAVALTTF